MINPTVPNDCWSIICAWSSKVLSLILQQTVNLILLLSGSLKTFSNQRLCCELFLLEPDWLSMELCRTFTSETITTSSKNGLREVAVALSQLKLTKTSENHVEKVPRRHFSAQFCVFSWTFLYRYISTYRLHAVKKRMKDLADVIGASEPKIELGYCFPYRVLATKERNGYMFFASSETLAEDISTYWRMISKDQYFSPLLEILCESENKVLKSSYVLIKAFSDFGYIGLPCFLFEQLL